jgi:gamma-glutamyltranspeptidase/glutathione hydrolase
MTAALAPAIDVAENGYELSQIQNTWTEKYYENILRASPYGPYLIMEDGRTIGKPGDIHCQPDLARTLRRLAVEGVDSFYRGSIADEIEANMIASGGFLRKADLVMYRVRERPPARGTYRDVEVLTVGAPGGGETLIEALNIMETFEPDFLASDTLERHHTLVEAFRIAGADRINSGACAWGAPMTSKTRARDRAAMIVPGRVVPIVEITGPMDPGCLPKGESTTQVSIIDQWGNAVSLTQTLSRSFGAKVVTPHLGFFYNSFVESFNVDKPHCGGFLQPRSECINDMAPTIVLRNRNPVAVIGTPGSNRIPGILAQVISNLVDRGLSLHRAVTAPRLTWGGYTRTRATVEMAGGFTSEDIDTLLDMGYSEVERIEFPATLLGLTRGGGVNAVSFDPETGIYVGVIDPRRGGLALGPQTVPISAAFP